MVFEVGKADRQHEPKLKRAVLTSPATGRMIPDSQSGTCGVSTESPNCSHRFRNCGRTGVTLPQDSTALVPWPAKDVTRDRSI